MPSRSWLEIPRPLTTPHLPGLDALRAISLLMVILFHRDLFEAGWLGVQIFFVLSGYLITRTLWVNRESSFGDYVRNFYLRRSLRIFPLYYGYLGVIAAAVMVRALRAPGVTEGLPYALTYTYNFYLNSVGFEPSMLIGAFWSLAVEEQFYLVWPFLIFFCPPRWLKLGFSLILLLAPFFRLLAFAWISRHGSPNLPIPRWTVYSVPYQTPSQVDAFAMGALFALFPGMATRRMFGLFTVIVLASSTSLLFLYGGPWHSFGFVAPMLDGYGFVWLLFFFNLWSAMLIDNLVHGRLWPRFFEVKALRYLGKISYGGYVFHAPLQVLVEKIGGAWPSVVQLIVHVSLTFAVAGASYHWFEARFLALKDRFTWFTARQDKSS